MLRRLTAGVAALCVATVASAAQPQFWKIEGARDFLEGDTEGLSVDSEGRVRLAPAARALHDPAAPSVWALARDDQGPLYAATGNEGRVFRIEGAGTGATIYDAPELEIHALALGKDGRLFAGSSPDGKVYLLDRSGRGTTFFDPEDKYIWALALDDQGRLLVATGSEGKVHRVDREGKAEVLLSGLEGHITALATDAAGNVYAGSSPGGVLYRIDGTGKIFVLHDSPFREVKALQVGADGSLYAAVIDGRDRDESGKVPPPMLPAPPPAAPSPVGEVTVTESFSIGPPLPAMTPPPRPLESARASALKGAVLRVLPSGEIDTLWSSTEEMPHSLVVEPGGVLVGTGNKGHLYRIHDDRTWTMLASFPAEQVTSLLRTASGAVYLATSNPGRIHALEAGPAPAGSFVSKVKDTETISTWGRVRWEGVTPPGHPHRGHEPQRQHGDARRDVDRVVEGLRPPGGRTVVERARALPAVEGRPRRRRRADARPRHRHRGVPAAQPAPADPDRDRPPAGRDLPEADLHQRRHRDPRPGDAAARRPAAPRAPRRGRASLPPRRTAGRCTRGASRPSRGKPTIPTATRSPTPSTTGRWATRGSAC